MTIEHYPGMTEKALAAHTETAIERFSLSDALVIHRYGDLGPGRGHHEWSPPRRGTAGTPSRRPSF